MVIIMSELHIHMLTEYFYLIPWLYHTFSSQDPYVLELLFLEKEIMHPFIRIRILK